MVVAVVTWLASVAMVASVVMGVAREAVTVPRVDTPAETDRHTHTLMMLVHSGRVTAEVCLTSAHLLSP